MTLQAAPFVIEPQSAGPTKALRRTVASRDVVAREFSVVDASGIEAFAEDWRALEARCARPTQIFQSCDWVLSTLRLRGGDPRIIVGREGGEVVFIWPLERKRVLGIRKLSAFGEPLTQYSDALSAGGAQGLALASSAVAFVRALDFDWMWIRRLREDSVLAPALAEADFERTAEAAAPYVDLRACASLEALEATFCAKRRSERRRHARRLSEQGEVRHVVARSQAEATGFIREAFAFKREWARKHDLSAPAVFDPTFEGFFADAANSVRGAPHLRVDALTLDGRTIAVQIALDYRKRLFGHILAPAPGFEKFGLGTLLADHAIRGAYSEGYETFDTLAPADGYKSAWAKAQVAVRDYSYVRTGAGAALRAMVVGDLGRHARRLIEALPAPISRTTRKLL